VLQPLSLTESIIKFMTDFWLNKPSGMDSKSENESFTEWECLNLELDRLTEIIRECNIHWPTAHGLRLSSQLPTCTLSLHVYTVGPIQCARLLSDWLTEYHFSQIYCSFVLVPVAIPMSTWCCSFMALTCICAKKHDHLTCRIPYNFSLVL